MERSMTINKTSLHDLENLIKEAMLRIDDLSKQPSVGLIQEMVTINLATFTDSIEYIRKLVFGPEKDTERLQNFIIKIDTLLEINGFYKEFIVDFKDFPTGSFFKLHNDETKFVIKYIRLFYAIRFFPESFAKNLLKEEDENA